MVGECEMNIRGQLAIMDMRTDVRETEGYVQME
jgi:hypothetical protein